MNTGGLNATPPRINVLGVDSMARTAPIPALAVGQTYTVSMLIPLPAMPGLVGANPSGAPASGVVARSPLVTRPPDTVQFGANLQIGNPIAGLAIQHFEATGVASVAGQQFVGPTLPGGRNFTGFAVRAQVIFVATAATGAGNVTLTANGTLTLQSG